MPTRQSERSRTRTWASVRALGSAFPDGPFRCSVHSRFRSSLNLAVPGQDRLYSLVGADELFHPMAAILESPGGGYVDFTAWPVVEGTEGHWSGRLLAFGDDGRASVDFSRSERRGAEAMPRIDAAAPGFLDRLSESERILDDLQSAADTVVRYADLSEPDAAQHPASRRIGAAFRDFAALPVDSKSGTEGARRLLELVVGLGPGLTPSGDDVLVGYMAALRTGAAKDRRSRYRRLLSRAWRDGRSEWFGATTDVSASFLAAADDGVYSQSLIRLAEALGGPTELGIESALGGLRDIGHSSGLDAATGFLFGQRQFMP